MPILIVVVTLFEITKYDTNMEEGIIITVCNARKKATRNVDRQIYTRWERDEEGSNKDLIAR